MNDSGHMRELEWTVQLQDNQVSPGSSAHMNFTYENRNRYHHIISKIHIEPSWTRKKEWSVDPVEIDPMSEAELPEITLDIPKGLGGEQYVIFGVDVAGHNKYTGDKIDCGTSRAGGPMFLNINYNKYIAFVSRSNHPQDVGISDSIHNSIRDWGFETRTLFDDVEEPKEAIISDAKQADCLFGIAVPRYETVGGEKPQFHYLDGETGMALVQEIPIVIFEHESVDLRGIPAECRCIEFTDPDSAEFQSELNEAMLWVRQTIQQKKQQEMVNKLIKIGGAMGLGAVIHSNIDSTPEESEQFNPEE